MYDCVCLYVSDFFLLLLNLICTVLFLSKKSFVFTDSRFAVYFQCWKITFLIQFIILVSHLRPQFHIERLFKCQCYFLPDIHIADHISSQPHSPAERKMEINLIIPPSRLKHLIPEMILLLISFRKLCIPLLKMPQTVSSRLSKDSYCSNENFFYNSR